MRVTRRALSSLLVASAGVTCAKLSRAAPRALTVAKARVEWQDEAAVVATPRPRFTWTLRAPPGARNKRQSAFRLRVIDQFGTMVFDSGRTQSAAMRFTPAQGINLLSQAAYSWFLVIWDEAGAASPEVRAGGFTTGLLQGGHAQARWIAAEPQGPAYVQPTSAKHADTAPGRPLPIFRKRFTARRRPVSAVLAIAGLGQYRLFVNGTRVSPDGMNGAWTEYSKRILYDTYDIVDLLGAGPAWLAVELGNGFFNVEGRSDRYRKYVSRYGPPQLWVQLRLTFADGTDQLVVSDDSWRVRDGATTFTHIYGGEDFDARRDVAGWRRGRGADTGWSTPEILSGPDGVMAAHCMAPMTASRQIDAKLIGEPVPGVFIFDCGMNHSGRPAIRVHGLASGATVKIHPSELLGKDGLVDQASMTRWGERSRNIEFNFVSAGEATENWQPAFTYNGYRYLQVQGLRRDQFTIGSTFLTDGFDPAGDFDCSDQRINRIHGLIRQAVLSNAASCLTDCPNREKLGWLEQTYLNADTVLLNIDAIRLYEKICADIGDAQRASGMTPSIAPEYLRFVDERGRDGGLRDIPEWGAAVVLTAWAAYRLYGDTRILESGYPHMQAYARYMLTRVQPDGLVNFGIGDWYDFGPAAPGKSQLTSLSMTGTATMYEVFRTLSLVATVLGKPDAAGYAARSAVFKAAILANLYDPAAHQFDRGSQTANAMALVLDIAPPADRLFVLDNLVRDIRERRDHVSAGDVGFHYVVRALAMHGRGAVLHTMTRRDDKPSYGEQLAKGATSLTEAWDGERVSSQNHFMLGHIETWFYRGLGGIDVDLSGQARHPIIISPDWDCGVARVDVRYRSVLGDIVSRWARSGSRWSLHVDIPAGADALVDVPSPVPGAVRRGDSWEMILGSGAHHLASRA